MNIETISLDQLADLLSANQYTTTSHDGMRSYQLQVNGLTVVAVQGTGMDALMVLPAGLTAADVLETATAAA